VLNRDANAGIPYGNDVDAVGLVGARVHGNDGTAVRVRADGGGRGNLRGDEDNPHTVREILQPPRGRVIDVLESSPSGRHLGPPSRVTSPSLLRVPDARITVHRLGVGGYAGRRVADLPLSRGQEPECVHRQRLDPAAIGEGLLAG
jgi:hypothetical protein